ncbi:MAG: alanine--glyoxylate aminotransferase family protein [bacterium]|nr:alanine--glyoxylate aminotransferase family protein [bacterium]
MKTWKDRKTPVRNYYTDWTNWLPIMEAYEARKLSYFGTPPVNLVCALTVSLKQILKEGVDARFARHRKIGAACRAAMKALGMGQVPVKPEYAASTLTAPCYPEGVTGAELLPKVNAAGVTLAGGLHPEIKATYFRIGHMGAVKPGDLLATVGAIETALDGCGYSFEKGTGVTAAQRVLISSFK